MLHKLPLQIKKLCLFVAFSIYSLLALSQKHYIRFGEGVSSLPITYDFALNFELQYEKKINTRWYGFISLGYSERTFTDGLSTSIFSFPATIFSSEIIFNYDEQFRYMDLGLKYRIFEWKRKIESKAVLGPSMGQSIFNYPTIIPDSPPLSPNLEMVTRRTDRLMLLMGIEFVFHIQEAITLSSSLQYRNSFRSPEGFEWGVALPNSSVSYSYSGFKDYINLILQMGFHF